MQKLVAVLLWSAWVASATESGQVRMVDDQGAPLAGTVDACFQVELAKRCVSVAARAPLALPPVFTNVRIEGADYGPRTSTRDEIGELLRQSRPLPVPRKATLALVHGTPDSLSLYPTSDDDLERPLVRIKLGARSKVTVPAGEYVASIGKAGRAPDVQRLSLAPGSSHGLRFTERKGWSLVLRVVDAKSGQPVPGAAASLRPMPGYAVGAPASRDGRADELGFVLFNGLPDPLVEAALTHRGFLPERVAGLIASPGSLAFRRVELGRGATLRAEVLLNGKPVRDGACEVHRYVRAPAGGVLPPVVQFAGKTTAEGVCRSGPLADGNYILRVSVPRLGARTEAGFTIASGQDSEIVVELARAEVAGKVTRGEQPAIGFLVEAHSNRANIPARKTEHAAATARTDEDGAYELVLWSPGEYVLVVSTAAGTPAAAERVELDAGRRSVDFVLAAAGISGTVVDAAGKPMQGVTLLMQSRAGTGQQSSMGSSEEDGTFHFAMKGSGRVRVEARHEGYTSQPVELQFDAALDPPPLRIVLTKEESFDGRLLTVGGTPVSAGSVAVYVPDPTGQAQRAGEALTDAEGRFTLSSPPTSAIGFASGPGCPLTYFDVAAARVAKAVRCGAGPAAISLKFDDEHERPFTGARLILAHQGVVIPWIALASHLASLGLPAASDGQGRLVLAGLAPGEYRAYLMEATNEAEAWLESNQGYLGSFSLTPFEHIEMAVRIQRGDLPNLTQGPPDG